MTSRIEQLRLDYTRQHLLETDVDPDPIAQFGRWMEAAIEAQLHEPNAMTVCTASSDGVPSGRLILLRGYGPEGFTFFTNYDSPKGHDLDANPNAALVFWWGALERQVRIQGRVERVDDATSDAYFATRPRGSQLGAWASAQSSVLPDRTVLEQRMQEVTARFEGQDVPRPPYWGGYRVIPSVIEFWQGRQSRLHDRLCYTRTEVGWRIDRLSP